MESIKVSSKIENSAYTNKPPMISPFSYLHNTSSNSEFNLMALKGSPKSIIKNHDNKNNNNSFHQRCSSACSLLLNIEDDQPSWLDDLLDEPETSSFIQHKRNLTIDSSSFSEGSYDYKSSSSEEMSSKGDQLKHEKEDHNMQSGERSNETKRESKRTKQHSAHRSRVRKLKYIAELERIVKLLQVEGSEIQAELEFLNQQNLILNMENMALRQCLDTVTQEQFIKNFEQEMLEREFGRFQTLRQLHNRQQMQIQHQMMHH